MKSREPEALRILANAERSITASDFAEEFWPDANMHTKISNQGGGSGSCRGKGAWFAGSCYLAKLKKKGLVKETPTNDVRLRIRYLLTEQGKKEAARLSH